MTRSFDIGALDTKIDSEVFEFLGFVDVYLLEDLKSMDELKNRVKGKCTYPMILTIISGMDLMGSFVYGKRVKGNSCLRAFIMEYMTEEYHKVIDIFYELIRNGAAHYYLMKKGIAIGRNYPQLHLKRTTKWFHINLDILYKDFLEAYSRARNDIEDQIIAKNEVYIKGYNSLIKDIEATVKYENGIMDEVTRLEVLGYDFNAARSLVGASITGVSPTFKDLKSKHLSEEDIIS